MDNRTLFVTSIVSGLLLLVLLVFFLSPEEEPAPAPMETPAVIEPRIEPVPVTPAPPLVVEETAPQPEPEPIPEPGAEIPNVVVQPEPAPPEPEPIVLPGLNASDPFVDSQINDLPNANAIRSQVTDSQFIRKFAVMVDGMSRGGFPDRDLPVHPPQSDLSVTEQGEQFYRLDPASYDRFTPLVDTFTAIDSEDVVASYQLMAPLLESAFAELGYPDRTFATSLQEAIDNILAAEVPEQEILLTRPSVNYEFVDSRLENLSDLEKLLIRMGPENTAKIQQKAREIKALLAD